MTTNKQKKQSFDVHFPGTMRKILHHDKLTTKDYMETYSATVEFTKADSADNPGNMIGAGNGQVIYESIRKAVREFVAAEAEKVARVTVDDDRLRQYKNTWDKFAFSAHVTNGLFRYVNQHWVVRMNSESPEPRTFDVYTACMVIWKEEMLVNRSMGITASAVNLLKRDRDGESGVDENLIKAVVESLVALGIEYKIDDELNGFKSEDEKKKDDDDEMTEEARKMLKTYEDHFEKDMLDETIKYYEKESASVIEDGDIIGYMRKTEERLIEEADRSRRCLHDIITNKRLQKAVETAYIEKRLSMFQGEFRNLLVAERIGDMNLMFRLCSRVDKAVNQLRDDFCNYIAEKGREAIANIPTSEQNDPKTYVHTVLKVHDKFLEMVGVAFGNDGGFMEYFTKGCGLMVNKNKITQASKAPGKTSEMLGRFVDVMMRKGGSDDFEKAVDQAMTFFMFIEDKDIFQKYYNRFLAKRLLMELSMNEDAETSMISRLKTACGHQYTATAVKMFSDMNVSKQISTNFKEEHESKVETDANFQILSSGSWPYSPPNNVFNVPRVLETVMSTFTAHYTTVHQGRKLSWLLSASRGELLTKDFSRKYTFSTSTAQMVVLLKYNDNTAYTSPQLCEDLNMPTDLLQSVLASLVKADLLKYNEDSEEYVYNKKFTSKRVKLDLQKLQLAVKDGGEAAKKEQQALEKSLDEDRKVVIQAAIVRIMKMRRRLQHNALITEVVEQVTARFQPRIPMIKKCIDLLMEKQYVERSKDDKDVYEYIS